MSNGDQTNLVPNQQPMEQSLQPKQKSSSLYEIFGSMTADQALKFKSGVIKHKQQKEISRNVGTERAESLINDYKEKGLSISAALDQSKKELSPTSKELDNLYFSQDVTPEKFLTLRSRKGQTFTKQERNLWFSHYNSLLRKENNELVKQGKISKVAAANFDVLNKAQVDYNNLQSDIERSIKGFFEVDKYDRFIETEDGSLTFKTIESEEILPDGSKVRTKKPSMNEQDRNVLAEARKYIVKAMSDDLSGIPSDQREMQRQLSVISNLVPLEFLAKKRGILIGDDFIDTYGQDYDEVTLRRLFFDGLNSQLTRAKNHLTEYNYSTTEQETETDEGAGQTGQTDWSQYMVE